ncbi:uridine kinase [soil metagenome]
MTSVSHPAHRDLALALIAAMSANNTLNQRASRTVIGIAGESGSGKSITAVCLARELCATGHPADVLHQDDYFLRPPAANHAHRVADLTSVGPQEVDFDRLRAHVAAFRRGDDSVAAPRVDYGADRFDIQHRDFRSVQVLVVDGTYVLANVDADIRIFLEATSNDTHERRRARNRDIEAPIVDQVLAIEHPIIAAQRNVADIVINRDFRIVRTAR